MQSSSVSKMAPGTAYFIAGVHPHYASELTSEMLAHPRALLSHPNAVAVGETGLDYNRDLVPRDVQRAALEAQVELACTVNKPLFLHEREASKDLLAILDNFKDVVHCFTGDDAIARGVPVEQVREDACAASMTFFALA